MRIVLSRFITSSLLVAILTSNGVFSSGSEATMEGGTTGGGGDAGSKTTFPPSDTPSVLSEQDHEAARKQGETHKFDAEVDRMMNMIINSIYKEKEIFLRELISNGSDALDKIRFQSLTKRDVLADNPDLKISIHADKERKTLTVTDTGIGMTKEDLKKNLGVIAKSGTSEFLNQMESNQTADMGLIGQFGVGFYSAFLVAENVVVVSKHNSDDQYIWESNSQNDFVISKDPRGNTLGRGTQIIMHLKDEAADFLEESTLKDLVQKYSEFINFPIYLWSTITTTEEVPDEDAAENEDDDQEKKQDEDVEDVEDVAEEKKPKTKTVTHTSQDWKRMNENKPIWTRNSKEVSEEEYSEFYRAFSKDTTAPLTHIHFHAEGELEFRSILFIPSKAPQQFLQKTEEITKNIKLFVKRVFITDELTDFLPRYLSFLKGLVDSDDLPLNVSRENLQNSARLKLIKKKVIGKAMEMLRLLSKDEEKWGTFIKEFGTAIKLGIVEDSKNRKKLSKLVRFQSSNDEKGLTGLDEYISRMRKGQPQIYICTGSDMEEIKRSPLTEKIIRRGYEVLYMDEPIDEYVVQSLSEYDGHKLQHIAKAGLLYGDEDEDNKEVEEAVQEQYKPLTEYLQTHLSEFIEKVVISNKLTKSPCAIVATQYGISGTMEKLMQAQALGGGGDDFMRNYYLKQKKILEINPAHPIMERLLERVGQDSEDEKLKQTVHVLYETALLRSGYQVPNTMDFAKRIEEVVRNAIGVDLEKEAKVDIKPAPEVEEKEDGDKKEDEENIDYEADDDAQDIDMSSFGGMDLGEDDVAEDNTDDNDEDGAHDEL